MSTEANNLLNAFVYLWHTRLNTLITFSFSGETINQANLISYMDFMINVRGEPVSKYGKC